MNNAKGKWITFIDADDRIAPDHLQRYMDAVAQAATPPDMVIGGFDKPIPNGTTLNALIIDDHLGVLSPPWNKLYRADFVRGHQFNTRITMFEDALFNNELLTQTTNVLLIPMTGYRYQPAQGNATSRYHATLEEGWDACTQCRRILLKRAGWSEKTIAEHETKGRFMRVYEVLGNLFKKDSPFTLCQKHREVKRIVFQDRLLAESMHQHRLSEQRLMLKLYMLCYLSHSAWIMTLFMALRQRLK